MPPRRRWSRPRRAENCRDVLEAIVKHIPAPTGDESAPLQALIFDAFYDNYRGAICFVRVMQGTVKPGMRMRLMQTGSEFDVVEVGTFRPGYSPCDALLSRRRGLCCRLHQGRGAIPVWAIPSPTQPARRTSLCPATAR